MIEITNFVPETVVQIEATGDIESAYAVYGTAEIVEEFPATVHVVIYGTEYDDEEVSAVDHLVTGISASVAQILRVDGGSIYPEDVDFDEGVEDRMIEIIKNKGVI